MINPVLMILLLYLKFDNLSSYKVSTTLSLFRPIKLELSSEEEIVASMPLDIIRKNDFTLIEDLNAPPGCHYKLKSIPFSKNITFGVEARFFGFFWILAMSIDLYNRRKVKDGLYIHFS
ncbi:hypothetical protein HN51_065214 [Arachis hypogaea]